MYFFPSPATEPKWKKHAYLCDGRTEAGLARALFVISPKHWKRTKKKDYKLIDLINCIKGGCPISIIWFSAQVSIGWNRAKSDSPSTIARSWKGFYWPLPEWISIILLFRNQHRSNLNADFHWNNGPRPTARASATLQFQFKCVFVFLFRVSILICFCLHCCCRPCHCRSHRSRSHTWMKRQMVNKFRFG